MTRYGIVSRERDFYHRDQWCYSICFYESREMRDEFLGASEKPITIEFELDVEGLFPPDPPEPIVNGECSQN